MLSTGSPSSRTLILSVAAALAGAAAFALLRRRRQRSKAQPHHDPLHLVPLGAEARRQLFLMDPGSMPMNHGSYGAVPTPVRHYHQSMLDHVEHATDMFFRYRSFEMCEETLREVSPLLGLEKDVSPLVFVPNATTGCASVVESFVIHKRIQAGDVVLATSLIYGAVRNILMDVCERTGASLVELEIALPVKSPQQIVDQVRSFLTSASGSKVKLAVFDHITSATAMLLPIKQLSACCHDFGVPVLIDGAHAIGHVPIDLSASASGLGCDFYTSNFHKWLFAPKGSAFLYVHPRYQASIRPLLVSHEWKKDFKFQFYQQATRDYTPYLSVKAAVQFYRDVGQDRIVEYNSQLCRWAAEMMHTRWKVDSEICTPEMHAPFMCLVPLPGQDPSDKDRKVVSESPFSTKVMELLIKKERCVGVVMSFRGRLYVRLSCNIYLTKEDFVKFADILDQVVASARATYQKN